MADVKIWQCRGCDVVHMGVGGMILNFSREDFASFTEDVLAIHYDGWSTGKNKIIDLVEHDAENYADAVFH